MVRYGYEVSYRSAGRANAASSMAVRCLIDVRAGVEWTRAMAVRGLITILAVVYG